MRKGTSPRLLIGLAVILAALLLALFSGRDTEVNSEGEVITHTVTADELAGESAPPQELPAGETPAETGETPEPTPLPDTTVRRQEEDAPADYFDDAAFVGNAQIMALGMYDYDGILTNADFYETETITDSGWLYDLDEETVYGKFYLGVGSAELAYSDQVVRRGIEDAASALRQEYPDCIIYLMAVPPVSEYKSGTSNLYNKDRVLYFNEMLQRTAAENGLWFVDVYSAVCDENGYLPSEVTVDGMNFTPGQYAGWYALLAENYVGAEPQER